MKAPFKHCPTGAAAQARHVNEPRARLRGLKRILVPVSLRAGSVRALRDAAALARAEGAQILPLHITPPICYTYDCGYGPVNREVTDERLLRRSQARLKKLVEKVSPNALVQDGSVRNGHVVEQIVRAARDWKPDLIIMLAYDAQLKGSLPQHVHTVDEVMRQVRCPVLVLHGLRSRKQSVSKTQE